MKKEKSQNSIYFIFSKKKHKLTAMDKQLEIVELSQKLLYEDNEDPIFVFIQHPRKYFTSEEREELEEKVSSLVWAFINKMKKKRAQVSAVSANFQ